MRPRRLAVAAASVLAALLTPAAAGANPLSFEHVSTQLTDASAFPDGIIGPGDTFKIRETVLNNTVTPISSLTGTLSTTANVSIIQGSSPLTPVGFGQQTWNTTDFTANVPAGAECGTSYDFALGLSSGTDATSVPFSMTTGAAGSRQAYDSANVPLGIPDGGKIASALDIADAGRVKDVRVRITKITHPYDSDLTATLIAPDGTRVELFRGIGGSGDNFTNTVLATSGAPISGAAPFTGTWGVDGLRALVGHKLQGTWRLEVADATNADTGTIDAWGLDLTPATCAPQPVASFTVSPSAPAPNQTVTYDAGGSTDPVGTINRYEWDLDGNGTYETDTGTNPVATTIYATRGLRTVSLRVSDDTGHADITTRSVSVSQAPVASFTVAPASPLSGQATTLDASASHDVDVGGRIVRYEWDLDGNGSYETDGGGSPTMTTSFARPGVATVRLRVTDDDGSQATMSQSVTVANRAPTAALTVPAAAILNAATTLDASGSGDPDGAITEYAWDFDNNGRTDQTTQSPTVQHTFAATGPVTVKVTVTDDFTPAASASATASLVVTQAPVAAVSATPSPARPGQAITLDASGSSDPDGQPLAKYEWDVDGTAGYERDTGTTPTTTVSWATTGTRTIRVRVTDAAGAAAVKALDVSVVNQSPVAQLSVAPSAAITGQTVLFDASASSDPDGNVARYEWDLDGNGVYELDTGTTPTASRTYPNATVVAVAVRVTDNDGATATRMLSLNVDSPVLVDPAPVGPGTTPTTTTTSPTGTSPGGTTSKPGASTSPPGGTGGGGDGGTTADRSTLSAALTGAAIQPLKTVLKRGLRIACRADRPTLCSVTAEVQGADAKRLKLVKVKRGRAPKAYKVGAGMAAANRAADATIAIKLPAKLKRALGKRKRSVLIVIRGVAADASGHKVSLSRAVLLR